MANNRPGSPGLTRPRNYGDWYLLVLTCVLLGYATLGKTFAYIGFSPIFISEIVLLLGFFAFVNAKCIAASLSTFPALCLIALMGWALLRTIPYIGDYGIEALRDSVTILYAALALIVISLLLQDAGRINYFMLFYRRFAALLPPAMTVIAITAIAGEKFLPKHPSTGVPIITFKAGDLGAHLGGVCVFVLLGFYRPGRIWAALLAAAMIIASTQNRGAMLAMLVPLALAVILCGKLRSFFQVVLAVSFCVSLAYAADVTLPLNSEGNRAVGARQLVDNMLSVVGTSNGDLEGTKRWRLAWWQTIQDYTFFGDYFWTGKGFGVNLAESDGFIVGGENPMAPMLRSPHNVHLAILARAGVPGLVLWLITLAAWFATLFSKMLTARLLGERQWSDFFLFVQCYLIAILITASLDVALEGPILGFWFWSIFGVGLGSVMIYRARPMVSKSV